jgi:hypothetical protein
MARTVASASYRQSDDLGIESGKHFIACLRPSLLLQVASPSRCCGQQHAIPDAVIPALNGPAILNLCRLQILILVPLGLAALALLLPLAAAILSALFQP